MDMLHDFDEIEEVEEFQEFEGVADFFPERHPYTVRYRENYMETLSAIEFKNRFRLNKETVQLLFEQINDELVHVTNRNHVVTPMQQLLICLRFYATGSMYIVIGDFGSVHKSTAGKIIKKVTNVIAALRPTYVSLPDSDEEREAIQQQFYRIARFPRVIGAVDCTHIRIQSPGGDEAEIYRNRKGFFSLNIQAICDSNNKLLDIVARWPGSAHDSYIFDNSSIMASFERGTMRNTLLLGNGGYPVRRYLITPLQNPQTPEEILFNEAQIRTRNVIERTFGIWKRRIPVLSTGMRLQLPVVQNVIVATAVLHNLACTENDELPQEQVINVDIFDNEFVNGNIENDAVRMSLVQYFATLL